MELDVSGNEMGDAAFSEFCLNLGGNSPNGNRITTNRNKKSNNDSGGLHGTEFCYWVDEDDDDSELKTSFAFDESEDYFCYT